jgi:hypothetical protein
MKLRIARKILKAVGTPRETAYSQFQIDKAFRRCARTESERSANRLFHALMVEIGLEGRVEILRRKSPGLAFQAMMEDSLTNRDRIVKRPV